MASPREVGFRVFDRKAEVMRTGGVPELLQASGEALALAVGAARAVGDVGMVGRLRELLVLVGRKR